MKKCEFTGVNLTELSPKAPINASIKIADALVAWTKGKILPFTSENYEQATGGKGENRAGAGNTGLKSKIYKDGLSLNSLGTMHIAYFPKIDAYIQCDFHGRRRTLESMSADNMLRKTELDYDIPVQIHHHSKFIETYNGLNSGFGHTGNNKIKQRAFRIGSDLHEIFESVGLQAKELNNNMFWRVAELLVATRTSRINNKPISVVNDLRSAYNQVKNSYQVPASENVTCYAKEDVATVKRALVAVVQALDAYRLKITLPGGKLSPEYAQLINNHGFYSVLMADQINKMMNRGSVINWSSSARMADRLMGVRGRKGGVQMTMVSLLDKQLQAMNKRRTDGTSAEAYTEVVKLINGKSAGVRTLRDVAYELE